MQYDILTTVAGGQTVWLAEEGIWLRPEDDRGAPRGRLRENEPDMVASRGTEVRPENVGLQDLTPRAADVLVTAGPYGCAHLIRGLLRVALPALVVIRLAFFAGFGLDRGVGWRRFWRSSSSLRSHQEAVALPFFLLFASVCRKPIASFAELKGP